MEDICALFSSINENTDTKKIALLVNKGEWNCQRFSHNLAAKYVNNKHHLPWLLQLVSINYGFTFYGAQAGKYPYCNYGRAEQPTSVSRPQHLKKHGTISQALLRGIIFSQTFPSELRVSLRADTNDRGLGPHGVAVRLG